MRKLEDLKSSLLKDEVDKFYVFYGDDFGIRKHYIEKLGSYFSQVTYLNSWTDIKDMISVKSLFNIRQLILVYDDTDFAKQDVGVIKSFIDSINNEWYCCVFIYDDVDFIKSSLYKNFDAFVTEFPAVQTNVAEEFVESVLNIPDNYKNELAVNCNNLYNNILLEADKIKNYADALNISQQQAYEDLMLKNQLLIHQVDFECDDFMNAVVTGNYKVLAYWCDVVTQYEEYDMFFYSITRMFNDFLICGLVKKYGEYDGSSRAYNYGLPWGRAKLLRTFNLPFDADYYFDSAFKVAEIDELVKSGRILKQNIINYFIINVI